MATGIVETIEKTGQGLFNLGISITLTYGGFWAWSFAEQWRDPMLIYGTKFLAMLVWFCALKSGYIGLRMVLKLLERGLAVRQAKKTGAVPKSAKLASHDDLKKGGLL